MPPPPPTTITVGYIGLGNAGYPMAANLPRAGFHVIVRDADPSPEEKFVKEFPGSEVAAKGSDEEGGV